MISSDGSREKALECTTRYVTTVEAEIREYIQDHFKSRIMALRPHRINDVYSSNTFVSSTKSIRGYTMFQMSAFRGSKHEVSYLMRKEYQASEKFRDLERKRWRNEGHA